MTRNQREELGARNGNRRIAVRARALDILRNTPGLMTMAEAVAQASAEFKVGLLNQRPLVTAGTIDPRD